MENPKLEDLPKYMSQSGVTQFELAQSIDAAMANAELEVKSSQGQESFIIWCEQLLDSVQEDFSLHKDLSIMTDGADLEAELRSLLPVCWAYYSSKAEQPLQASQAEFSSVMTGILGRSFINTLDILHARNIWRFDLQRSMQQTQTCLLNSLQVYVEQLCKIK
ncbi:MAG: hypothetical protein ACJA0E_000393 [Bermanella sp.]|jgi:hypothetical protein